LAKTESGASTSDAVEEYKKSLERVFESENPETLEAYKSGVEKLLGLEGRST